MLAMSPTSTRELLEKMAGVFVPISTPFADDEAVDYDALIFNLGRYAQSGVLGYLALGSNGENRSLTEEEKIRVLSTIVRHKGTGQVVRPAPLTTPNATPSGFSSRLPIWGRISDWSSRPVISANR